MFSKVELPRNFYTKIILLENAYYLYPSQDKIAELLSLYQKGIEFYSSQSNKERADDLSDKIKMFQDWWNTDIRFEKSIPHSFNAGYLIIAGLTSGININKLPEAYNTLIKSLEKIKSILGEEI